jgi:hypothetical protein
LAHWSKTDAFAYFDVVMENRRWSWSGVSGDGATVVLVLWQDRIERRKGRYSYADDKELDAEWRRRPGHSARIRHLKHALDNLGGRFRTVIAKAEDTRASPRKIASCFPQSEVFWQLDSFDEESGAFTAHVLD